jgi:superfamily II helicase
MASQLLCQSCEEQKMSLQRVKSSLIKTMEITMCATCISKGYEPRYIILLAVHSLGMSDMAKRFIKDKRYLGEVIPASDILLD